MEPTTKEEMDYRINNEIIGIFMGQEKRSLIGSYMLPTGLSHIYEIEYPAYHQDWNKLMEVWAKLNEKYTSSYAAAFHNAIDDNEISRAYNAVVKAINWYNSTKQ